MKNLRKWTIFYINPYEGKNQCTFHIILVFIDRPDSSVFNFNSEDYLEMNLTKFKAIREQNIGELDKDNINSFIGVLYENFSHGKKVRIMLQNEVN